MGVVTVVLKSDVFFDSLRLIFFSTNWEKLHRPFFYSSRLIHFRERREILEKVVCCYCPPFCGMWLYMHVSVMKCTSRGHVIAAAWAPRPEFRFYTGVVLHDLGARHITCHQQRGILLRMFCKF